LISGQSPATSHICYEERQKGRVGATLLRLLSDLSATTDLSAAGPERMNARAADR
jgi:hypothetical protein